MLKGPGQDHRSWNWNDFLGQAGWSWVGQETCQRRQSALRVSGTRPVVTHGPTVSSLSQETLSWLLCRLDAPSMNSCILSWNNHVAQVNHFSKLGFMMVHSKGSNLKLHMLWPRKALTNRHAILISLLSTRWPLEGATGEMAPLDVFIFQEVVFQGPILNHDEWIQVKWWCNHSKLRKFLADHLAGLKTTAHSSQRRSRFGSWWIRSDVGFGFGNWVTTPTQQKDKDLRGNVYRVFYGQFLTPNSPWPWEFA